MTDQYSNSGEEVGIARFGELKPERVLYDFSGARIFTAHSPDGDCLLAYSFGETDDSDQYLVVPCSDAKIDELLRGSITLREVLGQPWAWIVYVSTEGEVTRAERIAVGTLPEDALPRPNTYLYSGLQPLFSVKLLGEDLIPGKIPASVVKSGIDHAYRALKVLVERALKASGAQGRPEERMRRHYDLPTQRLAFGSFEIAFGAPLGHDNTVDSLADTDGSQDEIVQGRVSRLIDVGAEWLRSGALTNWEGDRADLGAVLNALSNLAPPSKGIIQKVEVGGRLVSKGVTKLVLTRTETRSIKKALQSWPSAEETVVEKGFIRELDLDKQTFMLRSQPDGGTDLLRGWVADELIDDVSAAFLQITLVRIVGVRSGGDQVEVQRIEPMVSPPELPQLGR